MKLLVGTLVTVVLVLGASNVAATAGGGEGQAGHYEQCLDTCEAASAEICQSAYEARDEGRLAEDLVEPICRCGILVCANVCVREWGTPEQQVPLPQRCYDKDVEVHE